MLKDALSSLGAVLVLLVLAIVIGVGYAKTGSFLWFTPDSNETIVLTDTTTTDCQTNEKVSKLPRAQKNALAANASTSVTNYLTTQLRGVNPEIKLATYEHDQLWWRTETGHRLVAPGAKTMALEVSNEDEPSKKTDVSKLDVHPATRNTQIKKAISLTSKYLKDLGFKQDKFENCPIDFVGDPFNNCVANFKKANLYCNLIAGFGSFTDPSLENKYRLELTCGDNLAEYQEQVTPLLDTLTLVKPNWLTPDLAVFNYVHNGDFYRLDLGYHAADRHATFILEDGKYLLIDSGFNPISCETVRAYNVPTDISGGQCLNTTT